MGEEKYGHFLKLNEEKRARVLVAAYDEFLEKGYGGASTNVITQRAGISKGLLFHYFGNKEGLYKFLMRESVQRLAREILTALPAEHGDVFAIIKSMLRYKITVCLRYPKEADFLIRMWTTNLPEALRREREELTDMSFGYYGTVCDRLDENLLGKDVTKEMAAEILSWVCEKYLDKVLATNSLGTDTESWTRIIDDLDRYLDALKYGLYQDEGGKGDGK